MSSLTITLSGPKASEQQARNALVAEQFDVHAKGHDYGLPALSDQQAEAFVCCTGDDVDKAWDAVRPLGWSLRVHHHTPEPAPPSKEQELAERLAEYERRLAALEAGAALPPIRGGAVESPPAFIQASTYGAEQTRRAIGALLQRSGNIGTPVGGLVASGDMLLTAPASGMSVNVAPGEAYVPGSSAATQGAYYCRVSSTTNLAIAASDPSNPRIDRVSAVVADAAYTGSTNTFAVAVVTGTPTAGATLANLTGAAAAPASSLTDGYVLVPATSTNVTNGNISNVATVVTAGIAAPTPIGLDASKAAAASAKGQQYLASDTGAMYVSNGSSWIEDALYASGTDAGKPSASAAKGYFYYATDSNALYYSDGTTWRVVYGSRGAVNTAASESRTNTAYGTLTTPDQVTNVVLPTNGLLMVGYQATWQESVAGAARAAIFIGSNQLKLATDDNGSMQPSTEAAATVTSQAANNWPLVTAPFGLVSVSDSTGAASSYSGDVTTGQAVGVASIAAQSSVNTFWMGAELGGTTMRFNTAISSSSWTFAGLGGTCDIFAAAGTYTVSVQFKATSGSVTASNRKLWVQAIPFS